MSELVSEFGSLNSREKIKGFFMFVFAAVVALVWGAISPIVNNFVENQTIDFSTFGAAVNLLTIGKTAFAASLTYLGLTKYQGVKN